MKKIAGLHVGNVTTQLRVGCHWWFNYMYLSLLHSVGQSDEGEKMSE